MKKKTLRSLFSLLMALVLGVSLLTGCSGKAAERAEMQEDAETIQVYLWTNSLYETYACLLYTSPSPRDRTRSRMPSSA